MVDEYVSVEHKSWFTRIKESVGGFLVGVLMFLVSFPLLFWNEGRAVQRAEDLDAGRGAVVSVEADSPDPDHDGELVHLTGGVASEGTARDGALGVERDAIKLVRNVEMYQWKEKTKKKKKKKLGGGTKTVTTYRYERVWSDDRIDSGRFEIPRGHQNPASMPYKDEKFTAPTVRLGGFELSDTLVSKLNESEELPLKSDDLSELPGDIRERASLSGGSIYVGPNPSSPRIGDLRISYEMVAPADVTAVAKQAGSKLLPYSDEEMEGDIALLEYGTLTADKMFSQAEADNAFLTWILRIVGFLLMFFGLTLMLRPLSVVADVVPFIGSVIGFGTTLAAAFISFGLSLLTISVAWIFYRPLLAIGLIVVGVGAVVALGVLAKKQEG